MNNNYFGVCPICRDAGIVLNDHRDHWMVCHAHKVRWYLGSNLFSGWQDETERDWADHCKVLAGYQAVEAWFPEQSGNKEDDLGQPF